MTELREKIKQTIESEPVVVFIKGTPQQPLYGNSMRALDALRSQGAPIAAVDVLPDPQIRQELSALSSWPTIPQVFHHSSCPQEVKIPANCPFSSPQGVETCTEPKSLASVGLYRI